MSLETERLKYADIMPDEAGRTAQRLHIKKDDIEFIRKFYPIEPIEKDAVNKDERSVVARVSTKERDRTATLLSPRGSISPTTRRTPFSCGRIATRNSLPSARRCGPRRTTTGS